MELSSTNQEATTQTKVCSKCGRTLPVSRFSRRTSSSDGLQCQCKECQSAYTKRNHDMQITPPIKGDPSSPLKDFTPRQLIEELRNRGYRGTLEYTHKIKV